MPTKSRNTSLPPVGGFGPKTPTQETAQAPAGQSLKFIPAADLMADPNQPRKHFNPIDDKELLESIRTQGILQAILVRPADSSEHITEATGQTNGPLDAMVGKYLIVCGERRYRAAKAVLDQDPSWSGGVIPCQVKDLNDEQALEAQIVENLQRKDVHPMEEAEAFEHLAKRGLTQEEIGARVGKGDRFVRARLVLCKLNADWRALFLRHAIDLELALKICQFSTALQKQILKDKELSKEELADPKLRIQIRDFNPYRGDLGAACFDLTDPTLNPKMGACIGCPYNSATASLFPEDAERPRCMHLECYRIKIDTSFTRILATAKDDPEVILIKEGYRAEDDKTVEKLKKEGLRVLGYGEFSVLDDRYDQCDDPGTYSQWKDRSQGSGWAGQGYDKDATDKENREYYDDAVKDWKQWQKQLADGIKKGKYKKAIVAQGADHTKGETVLIEITPRNSGGFSKNEGPTPAQKVATGKATATDYELEITRLQEDIVRTKDKQKDHVFTSIVTNYKASPISHSVADKDLSAQETALMALFFLERLGGLEDIIETAQDNPSDDEAGGNAATALAEALGFKITRDKKKGHKVYSLDAEAWDLDAVYEKDKTKEAKALADRKKKLWDFVSKITPGQLALLFRRTILHEYGKNPEYMPDSNRFIMDKLAEAADPGYISIKEITAEAMEKGATRIKRAQDKIADYKKQKAAGTKKKASAVKVTATKKITPKKSAKKVANIAGKK